MILCPADSRSPGELNWEEQNPRLESLYLDSNKGLKIGLQVI